MSDRIIQSDTLQDIANALRGGRSQSESDKIQVRDFYLKINDMNDNFHFLLDIVNQRAKLTRTVNFPQGVTTVGQYLLKDIIDEIGEISLPNSITYIDENAFSGMLSGGTIMCDFAEGEVSGAPWGAPNTVTINYNVNFNS